MPLNTSTTYHASPPPPLAIFFCQHTYRKNVYRDEGVILSHICWGPGGPLPFSRPQTTPRTQPPPPPPPPSPPGPGIGWKVGGSRRMARCYAPPVTHEAHGGSVCTLLTHVRDSSETLPTSLPPVRCGIQVFGEGARKRVFSWSALLSNGDA